jgi:hypothetical protein
MEYITFSKINRDDFQSMKGIFNIFKEWKNIQFNSALDAGMEKNDFENKTIKDALKIIEILAEKYDAKFWHPTQKELSELAERTSKWQKLSKEEQKIEAIKEQEGQPLWDFDSWIDAIINAEIVFYDIVEDGINYKISLEQIAHPSGGIEAIENLIKVYGSEVMQNDMC